MPTQSLRQANAGVGIHGFFARIAKAWMPTFVGMTMGGEHRLIVGNGIGVGGSGCDGGARANQAN
jgi:hypothetical protein